MKSISNEIEKLVQSIVAAVRPLQIILFGSAARDEAGPASDLDLLVVMPEGTHRRHTAQRLYGSISGVTIPYDIVVATPTDLRRHGTNPGFVYKAALQDGRTVYDA